MIREPRAVGPHKSCPVLSVGMTCSWPATLSLPLVFGLCLEAINFVPSFDMHPSEEPATSNYGATCRYGPWPG